jgi:hypothetical protein
MTEPSTASTDPPRQLTAQQQKIEMLADEDPLLISQSLTYVTDDGSVLHSFQSAQFSLGTIDTVIKNDDVRIQFVMIYCIEATRYSMHFLTFTFSFQDSKFSSSCSRPSF